MSVSSLVSSITYATNGASSWSVPFYFIQDQDLLVQTLDVNGNYTNYVLNNDYTVDGVTNLVGDYPNGGIITFNSGLDSGLSLLIQRITVRTQEVLLVDNSVFNAAILNHVFDKLMLVCQEGFVSGYKGLAYGPPTQTNLTFQLGDWFKNANIYAGGVFGWINTQTGNPGQWRGFGPIALY